MKGVDEPNNTGAVHVYHPLVMSKIFDGYYLIIFSYVRKLGLTEVEAEDIASDTFYKLLRHGTGFANEGELKGFLLLTAKNLSLDHVKYLRVRHDNRDELMRPILFDEENKIEDSESRAELRDLFRRAIDSLPKKSREIFVLFFIHGMTNEEIAARLNIVIKSVANHRTKAIKRIRIFLKDRNEFSLPVTIDSSWYSDFLHHWRRMVPK